jgi:hypothetical protein
MKAHHLGIREYTARNWAIILPCELKIKRSDLGVILKVSRILVGYAVKFSRTVRITQ